MKILIFCPYYPPHIGGLELHSDEFNKYLSQKGIDITVFAPRLPKEAMENEIRHNNVKIIRFPAFEIIYNYPLPKFWEIKFWKFFFALFSKKFDIVISRTRFFNTSLLALIYSKIKKTRWIHIEHGSDFVSLDNPIFSKMAKFYDYTFGKLILKYADKSIANSIASADFCKRLVPQKNYEVIYRGIETEKILQIKPAVDLKNKYPDKIIITFIGRLIDGKGVSDLIKSISKIKNSSIKCFIIGDGPQKKNLEKLSDNLKVSDKVIFFGYKSQEEAIGILKISDIFVNPSHTEGLPSSVIEAALCQKPIIATNVGGTPEIITNGKSGFLIEPKNIDILTEKLNLLINNIGLRNTLGKNAFKEVENKFDWDRNILKYLDIFKKINDFPKKKIYILSSRHGGPYKQHKIISEEFRKNGFWVDHRSDLWGWIKLHFVYGKNSIIITNVPLFFRFTSKNFIFNIKGDYIKERSIAKNFLGYLYGLNKLWSEKIVLPSNYLKEQLKIEGAVIIPNAVSEKLISEGQKEKTLRNINEINLIMVTMFGFREKSEGVLKVIECLSKIKTENKITLNIFGKGSFENEIKSRALKISLPKNIEVNFRGYTKNINDEYRKADIFVYWSDLDVMPNVFLEAMAFGLPIITNDFPSFREIIKEKNIIAKTVEDFCLGLQKFLKDETLKNIVEQENKERVQKMSITETINSWICLIKKS